MIRHDTTIQYCFPTTSLHYLSKEEQASLIAQMLLDNGFILENPIERREDNNPVHPQIVFMQRTSDSRHAWPILEITAEMHADVIEFERNNYRRSFYTPYAPTPPNNSGPVQ